MKNATKTNVFTTYVIYFRRGSEKVQEMFSRKRDAMNRREQLKVQRRKFLGMRELKAVEIPMHIDSVVLGPITKR